MRHHRVLRVIAKLMIPFIMIFALYVQFHGDYGPGGGFQAGVLFAAAFILYALLYGLAAVKRVMPVRMVTNGVAAGVLLYAGVGFLGPILGANYLDYSPLAHDAAHGQHIGILLVEFGVGVTVASTMLAIFYRFAGRGRPE